MRLQEGSIWIDKMLQSGLIVTWGGEPKLNLRYPHQDTFQLHLLYKQEEGVKTQVLPKGMPEREVQA